MPIDTSHQMSPEDWREFARLASLARQHYEGDLSFAQTCDGIEDTIPELVEACTLFYRVELEARSMVAGFGESA